MLFFSSATYAADDPNDFGESNSVTVLASSSMTIPLAELAKKYSKLKNIDVNTVYEATADLLEKIKQGDPADVVVSPNLKYLEEMKAEGLIEANSIVMISGNGLSLVAAPGFKIEDGGDLKTNLQRIHDKTLMVIGNPDTTSLGASTRQSLQKLGLWQLFEKLTVPAPTSAKTVDMIIKTESAGIIYSSDAFIYRQQIQNLGNIPSSLHEPINYYAAIVVSDNMDKARNFLKFMNSKSGKAVFKSCGFTD